jgi:uncharacterized Zn-binding protein involved in type VI secretion
MGEPAAKLGDQVEATDIHIVMIPSPSGEIPTPLPNPFMGIIDGGCSSDVLINGVGAATLDSTASNQPEHIPVGGSFQNPPTNSATIISGSATVFINNKPAARNGDQALTCNDPVPAPIGTVIAVGNVLIGG